MTLTQLSKDGRTLSLDKCTEMLCEFGLVPSHARVYLAAVKLGIAPVSGISKASKVRREDTYRALLPLEKLGLVEKIPGKPVKIRALPVVDGLSVLQQKWKETTNRKERELALRKAEFLKQFKVYKESKETVEEDHFALLLEKNIILDRVQTVIKKAEKEIDAVTSGDELLRYFSSSFVSTALGTLKKKKVKVRIILELPRGADSVLHGLEKHFSYHPELVSLKSANEPMSHYITVDYKQVLLATSPQPSLGKLPYLWTDTPSFAELLQRHFEELWHSSADLKLGRTVSL